MTWENTTTRPCPWTDCQTWMTTCLQFLSLSSRLPSSGYCPHFSFSSGLEGSIELLLQGLRRRLCLFWPSIQGIDLLRSIPRHDGPISFVSWLLQVKERNIASWGVVRLWPFFLSSSILPQSERRSLFSPTSMYGAFLPNFWTSPIHYGKWG